MAGQLRVLQRSNGMPLYTSAMASMIPGLPSMLALVQCVKEATDG
jgi:hypothetical protein